MTQPVDWNAGKPGGLDVSMSLASGEETIPRNMATSAYSLSNGQLRLGIFRAKRSEVVRNIRMIAATAGIALTDGWFVAYEAVQLANGTWVANLVAQTADDATILTAASTAYTRTLAAPFTKQAGHYYGVGAFILGATTQPTLVGSGTNASLGAVAEQTMSPPLMTTQTNLGALPTQQAIPGNTTASPTVPYAVLTP